MRHLDRGRLAAGLGLLLAAGLLAAALAVVGGGGAAQPAIEAAMATPSETPAAAVNSSSSPSSTTNISLTDDPTPASEPARASRMDLFGRGGGGEATTTTEGVPTVEELLEKGLYLAEASPVHLAIRGTASSDTVRCAWRGIARTTEQRENAIRFWLGLSATDAIPDAAYLEVLFRVTLETVEAAYLETAISNFMAIAKGGLSTEYLFLTCYADYATTEYLLGAGPTTVTAAYDRMGEARSYELYRREHDAGQFGSDALRTRGEYEAGLQEIVVGAEEALIARIGGRESVVFLAPMGDHNAIAVEAWLAVGQWFLETVDGTVNALREGADEDDPERTQTLANLKTRVTDGAAADGETRIANVTGLQAHYQSEGAYGDITPGDGETTTFTPEQPPVAPTCTNGTVIASPNEKRELVRDCELLLAAKSTLAGTGTLNWSAATAIASWDGVTTGGDPLRVTSLDLASESLTGTIPGGLGRLHELTTLKLNGNSLTGAIPAELGWLDELSELRLTGNSLTGCIPLGLKDVATNDLSALNLLYCEPPAPGSVTAGTVTAASVALSWGAVADASKYRVEYRLDGRSEWITDDETLTGTTHTVDELACGSGYQFRVSAYGSGTTYAAAWGERSVVIEATTAECVPPSFRAESYSFTIAQNAPLGTAVGTVTATDAGDGTITYAITAGNDDEAFAIGEATGELTLAGTLNRDTTPTYALTVEAASGNGGAATVAVAVTVSAADYDLDDDGLIEIRTLAQLNAVRWDLDGDGSSTNAGHAAAYPGAAAGMGCPTDGCEGYELTADLDFDTDGSGVADAGDDYWNDGSGWEPIGSSTAAGEAFDATFEGNGRVIANLFIDRDETDYVGLFGGTGTSSAIRRVGLTGVDVTGANYVGGLVGWNKGRIEKSYASGSVSGSSTLGGLLGWNQGTVAASYADVSVAGGVHAGGLAGGNGSSGVIDASYASGSVSGSSTLGGLLGFNSGQVRRSYARGSVTASSTESAYVGGLSGRNLNIVAASYWDTQTSGQAASAGGVGKTTAELQTPTGYTGIYADWDEGAAGADAWDFGTASEYPVLNVDYNGDGVATWREFGNQRAGENSAPAFDEGDATTRQIDENTAAGEDIGAAVSATDADADTLTYSLSGTDAADFAIDTATGQLRTSAALDYETETSYAVTVGVSDGNGGSDSIAVTIEVLNVADTPPPAPQNVTTGTPAETSVELTWDAVAGAGKYRVEYLKTGETAWLTDDETLTATTHVVDELTCGTAYEFQVSAYGDGAAHTQVWGEASTALTADTSACGPPEFGAESYEFTVSANAVAGTAVGTVLATTAGTDPITYAITAGNTGDVFGIGEATGEITLAGTLAAGPYELTVSATAGDQSATVTVTVTVAAVPTTAPGAPQNVAAGVTDETSVALSWDAVTGASKYRVEQREDGAADWTTDDEEITATTHTVDELTCGTTYEFQVSAYGDGAAHTEVWGEASTTLTADTSACGPPEFREESYEFTVSANAAADTAVGTVTATTSSDEAIVYALTAGNTGDVFGIGEATGEITLAGTLGAGPYELTVSATAGDQSATATVTVTVVAAAALTAEFPTSRFSSASHSGTDDRPQVIVTFSRAVTTISASTPSVSVTGGSVSSVRAHQEEGLEHAWIFFLDPDGTAAVEFSLVADQACDAGGICAADGTQLSEAPATRTIPGPAVPENSEATGAPTIDGTARVYETLTADVAGIADTDGLANASYTYQWIADGTDIAGATSASYTLTTEEEGQTIQVRVSFSDDAGNAEELTSVATAAVAAATPLTASFSSVPEAHNGTDDFTFELRFSEEVAVGFATLRDDAFEETNGAVAKAQRLTQGSNIGWRITVTPDGNADVTVVLPATSDCGADGAICTAVGKPLSNRSEITVPGPSE